MAIKAYLTVVFELQDSMVNNVTLEQREWLDVSYKFCSSVALFSLCPKFPFISSDIRISEF